MVNACTDDFNAVLKKNSKYTALPLIYRVFVSVELLYSAGTLSLTYLIINKGTIYLTSYNSTDL